METRIVVREASAVNERGSLSNGSDNVIVVTQRKPRKAIACGTCRMMGFRCICTKAERVPLDANGTTKADRKQARKELQQKERLFQGLPSRPLPPTPTNAMPGSEEKLRIMEERERGGFLLHHPAGLPVRGQPV